MSRVDNDVKLHTIKSDHVPTIPGLRLVKDVISKEQEREFLDAFRGGGGGINWMSAPDNRVVLQYGYEFDYKTHTVSPSPHKIPTSWTTTMDTFRKQGYLNHAPDQVIVNRYPPGTGISAHTDNTQCFGEEVSSLSLGASIVMEFKYAGELHELVLPPRSLLILTGKARYHATHAIAARKMDIIDKQSVERSERFSITMRRIYRLEEDPLFCVIQKGQPYKSKAFIPDFSKLSQ